MSTTICSYAASYAGKHWKSGEFFAYAGDHNKEGLTADQIRLTVEIADRAPDGTVITCITPDTPSTKGPRSFPSIRHGRVNDDAKQVRIADMQIGKLSRLEDDFALDYTALGNGDANVLFDAFFLADPARHDSRVLELGVIPRPSADALAYIKAKGKVLGIHVDRFGVAWQMPVFDGGYVMPIPVAAPVLSGTIDRLDMLRWLLAKGIGRADLWYTGTGLGLEPIAGSTRLVIKRWSPIVR